ncbi:cytochrome P450 [Pluteus cervinus]|uniref:Cytochrome P450 n=1 Tax=Pluteus cervinus TaxID=181527 RepID=A0ACD3B6N8_9AGAR|nr:cytochrome P450 [Pluteus cervinus]
MKRVLDLPATMPAPPVLILVWLKTALAGTPLSLVASTTAVVIVAYIAALSAFRLWFHPLTKYPGPPLAAATTWYRAYFDVFLDGGWVHHLEYLHSTYGPIVRVAPNELHFGDPRAHSEIYGMNQRFAKEPVLYTSFATDESVFALFDFHEAMQRRNLIGPFFSRKAILNLENVVQSKIDILVSRLLDYKDKAANLDLAYRCTSLEIITSYCFAQSSNVLDADGFHHDILDAMDATLPMIWVFKHFPWIKAILLNVPEWMASYLKPSTVGILEQRRQMGAQIDQIMKDPSSLESIHHETIYHYFLTPQPGNDRLPPVTREWLLDEGIYMRFAGSDTVGNVCTVGTYHLLSNPKVKATLLRELQEAWPDKDSSMSYEALEKLPYLTAVIKESLRMASGIVTPLPRVVGPTDVEILGEKIPAGTVVAMGHTMVHRNPEIFHDPDQFMPERWLQDDAQSLDRYLVAFSKGPRSCLGINLAWCELYLIFANMFRKLDFDPKELSIEDVNFREYFVPVIKGHHLHAVVKSTAA